MRDYEFIGSSGGLSRVISGGDVVAAKYLKEAQEWGPKAGFKSGDIMKLAKLLQLRGEAPIATKQGTKHE